MDMAWMQAHGERAADSSRLQVADFIIAALGLLDESTPAEGIIPKNNPVPMLGITHHNAPGGRGDFDALAIRGATPRCPPVQGVDGRFSHNIPPVCQIRTSGVRTRVDLR